MCNGRDGYQGNLRLSSWLPYIHTYIHTYIHACIHNCCCLFRCSGTGKRCSNRKKTSCVPLLKAGFEPGIPDTKSPADWMLAYKPTELSRITLKTWTRQPVPMISEHSAHLTPLSVDFRTWLWRYTYLLLLISMLWHRQAIFKSKGDKLWSSAECRIWTRGIRHQIASRLNAHWQTDWAIEDQAKNCVSKIKHILSVIHHIIHYTICEAVCFQFTHSPCDDWENIYTLSYYHHQIGSMNYYPLFRVRSWNTGVRCMYFYILMFCDIHPRVISQKVPMNVIHDMCRNISLLKESLYLTGAYVWINIFVTWYAYEPIPLSRKL